MKKIVTIMLSMILCFGFVACGGASEKEVEFPELDTQLQSGGNSLNYSTYTEIIEDDKTSLKIDLDYENEVLTEGQTKAITNILDTNLSDKYKEMTVTIMQESPNYDFVEFEYNGSEFERSK